MTLAAIAGAVAAVAGIGLAVHGAFWLAARRSRKRFLAALGPVVRIATPCRIARENAALVPGTLGLTPDGLFWEDLAGGAGGARFEQVRRLETDEKLSSGRGFLRSQVVRVTLVSGAAHEFVVSRPHAWEWRQALGEWVGGKGGGDVWRVEPPTARGSQP